jgi:hypothetical protein
MLQRLFALGYILANNTGERRNLSSLAGSRLALDTPLELQHTESRESGAGRFLDESSIDERPPFVDKVFYLIGVAVSAETQFGEIVEHKYYLF